MFARQIAPAARISENKIYCRPVRCFRLVNRHANGALSAQLPGECRTNESEFYKSEYGAHTIAVDRNG